jgi:hypothetical protein
MIMVHVQYTNPLDGKIFDAILSPHAVRAMEQELGYGYARILAQAVRDQLGDMLAFCAGCLQHTRGADYTGDTLWAELRLGESAQYAAGMTAIRHLFRQIVQIDSPDASQPGDEESADASGNAAVPPTTGGHGSATTVTRTSKRAIPA